MLIKWVGDRQAHLLLGPENYTHLGGLALIALGAALRSWAAGIIHKQAELASEGPYALCRHPLYLGSFLMMLGFVGVLGDFFALVAILALFVIVYWPTMRREELGLAKKFGEAWSAYAARTSAFLPKITSQCLRSSWSWQQWRRNGEHRVLLRSVVLLLLLEWCSMWLLAS